MLNGTIAPSINPFEDAEDLSTVNSNNDTNENKNEGTDDVQQQQQQQKEEATTTTEALDTTRFPCIEQPLRVTLHCNGYYIWCLKDGRIIARKRRNDKDEFRLFYHEDEAGVVTIQNHKFGGFLSVQEQAGGTHKLVCPNPNNNKKKEDAAGSTSNTHDDNDNDDDNEKDNDNLDDADGLNDTDTNNTNNNNSNIANSSYTNNENEKNFEDKQKWCFIKSRHGVMLKSLSTGENLAIDKRGNVVFTTNDNHDGILWSIECVTGELCYLSNPTLDRRVRCDMAGLLFMTDNWKGWEVFRFMEASHGYVKISSWMHSQWLLCSNSEGKVSTCNHAESFLDDHDDATNTNNKKNDSTTTTTTTSTATTTCSKWAIEKSPNGNGVVIRSKTYGGWLSVNPKDGGLTMYQPWLEEDDADDDAELFKDEPSEKDKKKEEEIKNHHRKQWETMVWHLEAAHLQTYYFSSCDSIDNGKEQGEGDGDDKEKQQQQQPKSIGPFPKVTTNLRRSDKFQLVQPQEDNNNDDNNVIQLYNIEKKKYVACLSSEGKIDFVDDAKDPSTEWIMTKSSDPKSGGSVFQSKLYNLYLSYKTIEGGEADNSSSNNEEENDNDGGSNNNDNNELQTSATKTKSETVFQIDDDDVLPDTNSAETKEEKEQNISALDGNAILSAAVKEEEDNKPKNTAILEASSKDEDDEEPTSPPPPSNNNNNNSNNNNNNSWRGRLSRMQNSVSSAITSSSNSIRNNITRSSSSIQSSTRSIDDNDNKNNKEATTTTTVQGRLSRVQNSLQNAIGVGNNDKNVSEVLVGIASDKTRVVWKLDPSMPRAVSSEKIKTFALGTSIAVGTTIAMPFAMAGMMGILGAVGAEVGILANVVAVGLTGAEAIASVGAIGATAYIVFRPEDNSLTDQKITEEEEEAESAWSKRPFSDWRSW